MTLNKSYSREKTLRDSVCTKLRIIFIVHCYGNIFRLSCKDVQRPTLDLEYVAFIIYLFSK